MLLWRERCLLLKLHLNFFKLHQTFEHHSENAKNIKFLSLRCDGPFKTKSSRWNVTKSHLIMVSSIKRTTIFLTASKVYCIRFIRLLSISLHHLRSLCFLFFQLDSLSQGTSNFTRFFLLFAHQFRSLLLIFTLWFSFSFFASNFRSLLA